MQTTLSSRDLSTIPAFLVVALIAMGTFVAPARLPGGRPPRIEQHVSPEDARLAVSRLFEDPLDPLIDPKRGASSWMPSALPVDDDTLVLLTFTSGGPYAEAVERRLRNRVAVSTALGASGFRPDDPVHLRRWSIGCGTLPWHAVTAEVDLATAPIDAPFETFSRDRALSFAGTGEHRIRHVTVVWIDEFRMRPELVANRLATIVRAIRNQSSHAGIAVLGPTFSDTLIGLRVPVAYEVDRSQDDEWMRALSCDRVLDSIPIYTWSATLSSDALNQRLAGPPGSAPYRSPAQLIRTIPPDDLNAQAIVDELRLRLHLAPPSTGHEEAEGVEHTPLIVQAVDTGPSPTHGEHDLAARPRVLLVHEADTSFARGLALEIENKAPEVEFLRMPYLRGLDGEPPNGDTARADTAPRQGFSITPRGASSSVDPPVGSAQFDYLRRGAASVAHNLVDALRVEPGRRVCAVGVIGSDIYDKIALLTALKAELPGVFFFTTDLHARLLEPHVIGSTRNLVAIAPASLQPGCDCQWLPEPIRDTLMPFRDSFQTVLFRTTIMAIGDAERSSSCASVCGDRFDWPRPFEVGRDRFHDLDRAERCLPPDLALAIGPLAVAMLTIVLFSLLHMSDPMRSWWQRLLQALVAVLVLAGGIVLPSLVVRFLALHPESREPIALFAGVSIWPTQWLRFFVVYLAIAGVIYLAIQYAQAMRDVQVNVLGLQAPPRSPREYAGWIWSRVAAVILPWRTASGDIMDGEALWFEYRRRSDWFPRLIRVLTFTTGYVIAAMFLFEALSPEVMACRGDLAAAVDRIVPRLMGAAIVFATFWVWDTTNVCNQYISLLNSRRPVTYSPTTVENAHVPVPESASSVINVSLVAELTEAIRPAVYLPASLAVIALLSRWPLFDNYPPSIAVNTVVVIVLLIAVYSAWSLRRTAEITKHGALERLRRVRAEAFTADCLATGSPDAARTRVRVVGIDDAIRRVEGERRGAFTPWQNDVVLRAVLIPVFGPLLVIAVEYIAAWMQ